MKLNVVYDASVTGAPAGFVSVVDAVARYFGGVFADPVTVNVDIGYGQLAGQPVSAGALGQSQTLLRPYSYDQIRSALLADAKSSDDAAAAASLPGSSPVAGTFWVARAEAKALGLLGASTASDGYVGFSSAAPFDYDNSNGVTPGSYDFFGVVAHEISEIMGRVLLTGGSIGSTPNCYEPMDLFHYASPKVRSFAGGAAGFLSVDGVTSLGALNADPDGDYGDWDASVGPDASLAFGRSGVVNPITERDLRMLDVLGWDRAVANRDPDRTLVGTSGDDFLAGGGGNDVLLGRDGDDQLSGGEGDDYLEGDAGNDVLVGGNGDDQLSGGEGNDYLEGDGGNDVLLGGDGADVLTGGDGNDYLDGGEGNGVLYGGNGDDIVAGGGGDDYLNGGSGSDILYAKDGNDTLVGEGGDDYLNGGNGNDQLFGGEGADTLVGDAGNDYLAGDGGNDQLFGGAGNDQLNGGSGNDFVDGGAGDDVLIGADGNDQLGGGDGNDYIDAGAGDDVLVGAVGDDALVGGPGNDYLDGGEGADVLAGGDGNDVLLGGAGSDLLDGGNGDDVLVGGAGDDVLTGGAGADVFLIQSGRDTVTDFMPAGAAHDVLVFDAAVFGSVQDLLSRSVQNGSDTLVTSLDGASSALLQNVDRSSLNGSNVAVG